MLKEIKNISQKADGPKRRWFTGEDTELTIWLDSADEPTGFQLCFREADKEHALTWQTEQGLEFHCVDGGESTPLRNQSPILVANGQPHWPTINARFKREVEGMDENVRQWMSSHIDKLRFQGTGWAGRESELAPYCRWVEALNQHDPDRFVDFYIAGQRYGGIAKALRPRLLSACDAWLEPYQGGITLRPEYSSFEQRTEAFLGIARYLEHSGESRAIMNEPYPVTLHSRAESIAHVDRTVVGQLGLRNFSQHMNGYVRKPDGLYLWIGRRARDKATWPGKLDQMVAGGLPANISLADNLRKECHEEAGIPANIAARAQPVGAISYHYDLANGQRRDIMFCYDLELPEDFIPVANDGEVERFECLPAEEVARLVRETNDFKANCNLANIDFLMRHGLIDPERSGYMELRQGLSASVD
ncbi:MAG: NUDIX hydrolase [Gammaproteobacteria bacterium]